MDFVDLVWRTGLALYKELEKKYSHHQIYVQRVLATSSGTISISFCLMAIYAFFAIDPRRLVFRHQLIAFLIFFDLLKACILLLYPTRVMTTYSSYFNNNFCQIVGFFTATSIEGADLAILSFAIHMFLLIFKPSLNTKVTQTRTEGGLYVWRFWVYGLSFLIPIILASLAFIHPKGYQSYVHWCYLPEEPIWYRLVLSWVPRYLIVITIFVVYCVIYFHFIREFDVLGGLFSSVHKEKKSKNDRISVWSSTTFFFRSLFRRQMPQSRKVLESSGSHQSEGPFYSREDHEADEDEEDDDQDDIDIAYDPELQVVNLVNLKKRQQLLKKQMKSIFVYPFAYCFIWLFPFILSVTQFRYEEHNHPIFWLNGVSAFMQPANGFIDALVFFYREKPWKYTIMKNFEKEHESRMDYLVHRNSTARSESSTSKYGRPSLSESFGVDINKYAKIRQILNTLRLPLFGLPTEENLSKLQLSYMKKRVDVKEEHVGMEKKKNDFSDVLQEGMPEEDFHNTFNNYSMNFSQPNPAGRKNSVVSSPFQGISKPAMAHTHDEFDDTRKPSITDSTKEKPIGSSDDEADGEIDFLEFLRKGP